MRPGSTCRNRIRSQKVIENKRVMKRRPALGLAAVFPRDGSASRIVVPERKNLQVDPRNAGPGHPQLLGCAVREVDNTAFMNQIAAVRDADNDGTMVSAIDHPDERAERKCRVAGRHGIHVVDFAARCFAAVEDAAVPGSDSVNMVLPLAGCG